MTQRELAEKSKISNVEITRIESGKRKKLSPTVLKAFAPYLGVSYEKFLKEVGYLEEALNHEEFTQSIYKDENGRLIDIVKRTKDMYEECSDWANLAYRVSASDLTETELNIIKTQTENLLEQFLKLKTKRSR